MDMKGVAMDNSFGGMSEDDFFLGYDAMIDEDDPDSINYNAQKHISGHRETYYGGGCCCVALLPVLIIVFFVLFITA